MSPRPARRPPAHAFVLLLALAAASCTTQADAFYEAVFRCDSKAPDPDCGSNRRGAPLSCMKSAQLLGGAEICVDRCTDEELAMSDPAFTCLEDRSKVARCKPSAGAKACASPSLRCMRTNLRQDEGVCVPLQPCDKNEDCTAERPVCVTSVIRALYPKRPALALDGLHCLTVDCAAKNIPCALGEQCLRKLISLETEVPDVCLPSCDPQNRCPANHMCIKRISPAYPNVCVPGLLGRPCADDLDCLVGECTDVGFNHKACTLPCKSDDDCTPFDAGQTYFFCAESGRCISPESLTWPDCVTDADCGDPGLICVHNEHSPELGFCRMPCPADGSRCPSRAGIVHGCSETAVGQRLTCQPGLMTRYACTGDADCMRGLRCLAISDVPARPRVCTIPCETDDDCARNRQTSRAHCSRDKVCREVFGAGLPCDRNRQCHSQMCNPATGTCAALGLPE